MNMNMNRSPFITPRADALSRISADLVSESDPRHAMIQAAAADMERFERFLQSCFLDFRCECNNLWPENIIGPKCRACAAKKLYFDGLKTVPPTAYTKDPCR